jgi:uncharacterized protein (TIGR02453 family)
MDTKKLVQFLKQLKSNNNKPWFDEHRDEYQRLRLEFADMVQQTILLIAKFDPAVKFVTAKESMYRINRDIRFSKDKTLYKTNFGAGIGPGQKGVVPGYHLHIDASGKLMVAGGLYMLTPQQLSAVRESIVRQPGKLRKVIFAPSFKKVYGDIEHDSLIRAPRGFDPESPDIDLIKLKRFVAWVEWPVTSLKKDLPEEIATAAKPLYPLIAYLRDAI